MRGFVAFLDVLGFKQRVARPDFDDIARRYVDIIHGACWSGASYALASDSVILTVPVNEGVAEATVQETLLTLIEAVGAICHLALTELELPIRGGITFGSFGRLEARDGGTLVAGQGVVSAYQLEQDQDWVGVSMSPSILETFPGVLVLLSHGVMNASRPSQEWRRLVKWNKAAVLWEVPLRSGEQLNAYAVLPHRRPDLADLADRDGIVSDLDRYIASLRSARLKAPDARSQRKYEETTRFVQWARGQIAGIGQFPKD